MSGIRSNISSAADTQNWLEIVRQHVESLRFGTVEIVVHDSRVTQIEKTERVRFEKGASAPASDAALITPPKTSSERK